jgi:prepilin-type N-terminal cleavage/methylation domain-containing protein
MKRRNLTYGNNRRGLSLTEVLVALAISLIFLGSVVTAYVQIAKAADFAEAQVAAHTRARIAVDAVLRDLGGVRSDPLLTDQQFFLASSSLTYGDNIDNDRDGNTDEEVVDGRDNDGDWNISRDNHAQIGRFRERPDYLGIADLGDFAVDEDIAFSHDELSFLIPSDPGGSAFARRITYRVETFDSQDNVLVRRVVTDPGGANETTEVEPVVFEVVSFDVLAMNANDNVNSPVTPARPYWEQNWDSTAIQWPAQSPLNAPFGTPPFEFPSAIHVGVTVSAVNIPQSEIDGWPLGGTPLRTVSLSSTTAIEAVIKHPVYRDYVRRPQ